MKSKIIACFFVCVKVIIGSALFAAGFQYFLYPCAIAAGGITGVAMIINFLTSMPVGLMVFIINIPLFIFSWNKFGLKFIIKSLFGTVLSSVFLDLFAMIPLEITTEPLLAAVYGGILKGIGLGIVYHAGATTGGVDLIAKFLEHKYPHINFSTFILVLDVLIIIMGAITFRKSDSAMYAIICMFVVAKMIDLVLLGTGDNKVCYIISDCSEELKNVIVNDLDRGVTLLRGAGAWSGKEKNVILCAIKRNQIMKLKSLVKEVDESSFMIVIDSREVFGDGFRYIGNEE